MIYWSKGERLESYFFSLFSREWVCSSAVPFAIYRRSEARHCRRLRLWADCLFGSEFADFAPHIPAVGVLAVILCGMIARYARLVGKNGKNTRSSRRAGFAKPVSPKAIPQRSQQSAIINQGISSSAMRITIGAWPAVVNATAGDPINVVGIGDAVSLPGDQHQHQRLDREPARASGPSAAGAYQTTAGTLDTETWGLDDYRLALQSVLRGVPTGPKVTFASAWSIWACIAK